MVTRHLFASIATQQQQQQQEQQITCRPPPQTATASIFAPRTEDMNKGFLTFSEDHPGLTSGCLLSLLFQTNTLSLFSNNVSSLIIFLSKEKRTTPLSLSFLLLFFYYSFLLFFYYIWKGRFLARWKMLQC